MTTKMTWDELLVLDLRGRDLRVFDPAIKQSLCGPIARVWREKECIGFFRAWTAKKELSGERWYITGIYENTLISMIEVDEHGISNSLGEVAIYDKTGVQYIISRPGDNIKKPDDGVDCSDETRHQ